MVATMDARALCDCLYLTAADLQHVAMQLGVPRVPRSVGCWGARRWLGTLLRACPELTLELLLEHLLPVGVLERMVASRAWRGARGVYLWRGGNVAWTSIRRGTLTAALACSAAEALDRLVEHGGFGDLVAMAFDERAVARHHERWEQLDAAIRALETAPTDEPALRRLMQAGTLLGLKHEASSWCEGTRPEGAWAPWTDAELAALRSAIATIVDERGAEAEPVPQVSAPRGGNRAPHARRVRRRQPRPEGRKPVVDWLAVAESILANHEARPSSPNPSHKALAAVMARTRRRDAGRVLDVLQRAFAPEREPLAFALDLLCTETEPAHVVVGPPRPEPERATATEYAELDDDAAIELLVARAASLGLAELERDYVGHDEHSGAIVLEAVLVWHGPRVAVVFDLDERTAERWAARGYRAVDADAAFADAGALAATC